MHVWGYLGLRNFFPCIATNGEVAKPTIQVGGATISYDEYCRHAARVFSLSNADQRLCDRCKVGSCRSPQANQDMVFQHCDAAS